MSIVDKNLIRMHLCAGTRDEALRNMGMLLFEKGYVRESYTEALLKKMCIRDRDMEHLPHDCRHTFATRLSNYGANSTCIKKLIGHSSYTTTEKIYTHKDVAQLRRAISTLK